MKYILAIVPHSKEIRNTFFKLSKEISIDRGFETHYLLNATSSIPHISLLQFKIDFPLEIDVITLLWQLALDVWHADVNGSGNNHKNVFIRSLKIKYKYDSQGLCWAEILIDKKINSWLLRAHNNFNRLWKMFKIDILNASVEKYSPHITLFNSQIHILRQRELIEETPAYYQQVLRLFEGKLALGKANDQWELNELIYEQI